MTDEEKELTKRLREFLSQIAPPNTRIIVNDSKFLEVRICCDGSDHIMGYICFSRPGHSGLCYDANKHVEFHRTSPWTDEVRKKSHGKAKGTSF